MKLLGLLFIALLGLLAFQGCKPLINKMAFFPDNKDIFPTDQLPSPAREIFIETQDHLKIQAYFIPNPASKKILIYFHGNAGNMGHRLPDLMTLHRFGINVLAVDYRGYGKSQGKPTEKGIYWDGEAALKYATQKLGFPIKQVILFGRSIGTTVAIHTAQKLDLFGVILVSPLSNAKDHAKSSGLGSVSFLAGDAFNNSDKISEISCPLLILHGTEDEVLPLEMGKKIYNKANTKKQFVEIEGAGHNNLSTLYFERYWPPIQEFISG